MQFECAGTDGFRCGCAWHAWRVWRNRQRQTNRQTDRRTDGQTDGRTVFLAQRVSFRLHGGLVSAQQTCESGGGGGNGGRGRGERAGSLMRDDASMFSMPKPANLHLTFKVGPTLGPPFGGLASCACSR